MKIAEVIGKHAGETAWIVGKGPSLEYLQAKHFGAGPVITINEAILTVQDLGLSNPLYAMNKDGCRNEAQGHACPMVTPHNDVTIILQSPGFSEYCFPNHPQRIFVHYKDDLGFDRPSVMSVRMCIAIAKIMGCVKIAMVCCDSIVNGDVRIFDGAKTKPSGASGHYSAVMPLVLNELLHIPNEYILPRNDGK